MKTPSIALFALAATFATAQTSHQSGGAEHIVIIDNSHSTPPAVAEILERLELNETHPDVRHVFNNSAFRGFAASMKSHCLELLANMSDISIVEQAVTVTHAAAIPIERQDTAAHWDARGYAPWGLQRISTASFSATNQDPKALDYTYSYANEGQGAGADIYVVDTGLYADHLVFSGRAKPVWVYDNGGFNNIADGHGTHVAGTASGETLGVASNANVFGVQVLRGEGTGWSSNIVAGIDFVIQEHDRRKANASANGHLGSVINMSLAAGGVVSAIDQALSAAIKTGIHVVVAAGNAGQDACSTSPSLGGGLRGGAITVGSVDFQTKHSSFSNYGDCVDVYAPGESIISAWIGAPDNVNLLSGTSMATPHVTGIVAYAMANSTLANDPGLMKEWIRMQGLVLPDGTILANNGVQTGGPAATSGNIGFSRRRSFTTITSANSGIHKRAVSASGLQSLANWFMNLFGKHHHHRRSEVALSEDETNELRYRLLATLLANSNTAENKKRGISASGLQSLADWFMTLFGKHHHHKRAISTSGLQSLANWCIGLFKKHHHKRDDSPKLETRAISASALQSLANFFLSLFGKHYHKRDGIELQPRALNVSGLQSLANWFINLFGRHHHHKR
jgi:cerevisin